MSVRFQVEPAGPAVEARVDVLRHETENDRTGRAGMGLRFLEFFRQTEVILARLFLGQRLRPSPRATCIHPRPLARNGARPGRRRARRLGAPKVTSPDDPWRFAK